MTIRRRNVCYAGSSRVEGEGYMKTHAMDTACGSIVGIDDEGVLGFHGIRYASARRFEKPEVTGSWDGVFDATLDGPACFQRATFGIDNGFGFYDKEFKGDRKASYSEDCLRLNIIAPLAAVGLPVLVFIHGGGHDSGWASDLPYGSTTEYAKRGLVFVSIDYRLNVFSLYCDQGHNGNLGLHDIVAGLHWIRRNIRGFGGDPDRITLMGQSAGAMCIQDLCFSEAARGLFHGAVLMSGGGMIPPAFGPADHGDTEGFWNQVRLAIEAKGHDLRGCDAEELWHSWFEAASRNRGLGQAQPCVDGELLARKPKDVVASHEQLDIPYMLGVTSQDFMPLVLYWMARHWAKTQEKAGMKPVYAYFFDRTPPGGDYKAYHGVDLWYMFGSLQKSWRPFDSIDYELERTMMDYVANFAKQGDPNAAGLPEWKALSRGHRRFRLFDGKSKGTIPSIRCWSKLLATALWDKGPM